jgi:hypothetical protein
MVLVDWFGLSGFDLKSDWLQGSRGRGCWYLFDALQLRLCGLAVPAVGVMPGGLGWSEPMIGLRVCSSGWSVVWGVSRQVACLAWRVG